MKLLIAGLVGANVWNVLHDGILGVAAFIGASAVVIAFFKKFAPAAFRMFRQMRDVHTVILGEEGDEASPSLIARLEQGDRRMGRIESRIQLTGVGIEDVRDRIERVEGFVDALAQEDRLEIRRALTVVSEGERAGRRSSDPPASGALGA